MTKRQLIIVAVLLVVVAQALLAARLGLPSYGGRGFYDGQ
jgi:hypothetical protein